MRVAILISGAGSNMAALVRSMTGDHPARPVLVLSDVDGAPGLGLARSLGVEARAVAGPRGAREAAMAAALAQARADLICLAGFMRVLSPGFVAAHPRTINIHPSLLPRHRGLDTHARALAAGDARHGCTVHRVTAELDAGEVLGQSALEVGPQDTAETLAARVRALEHRLYPAVVRRLADAFPSAPPAHREGG
ncbi:MAG: phosphoribosylglycinamide formyltransferase [Paracoccaceae bacterium]